MSIQSTKKTPALGWAKNSKEQSLRDLARGYPDTSVTKKVMLAAAEEIHALRQIIAKATKEQP